MKIDTSVVCTSIPPKYRCVCPSCNCLDFINTSEYDQYKEEPSLPTNLDEAAFAYENTQWESGIKDCGYCPQDVYDAFKAGAEWQKEQDQETIELAEDHAMLAGRMQMKEQMMKDAVDGYVTLTLTGTLTVAATIKEEDNVGIGDKVRVIIVKEEG